MPPVTRKQSRIMLGSSEDKKKKSEGDEAERSIGITDNVPVEQELDGVNKTHIDEDKILFATPAYNTETFEKENAIATDKFESPPVVAPSMRSRTFSMEMDDAIEALHREDEEVIVIDGK
jgi:hypothetical protein